MTDLKSFEGSVWIDGRFIRSEFFCDNGKIRVGKRGEAVKASYIIPPFSEPHIHGGWGFSFQKGDFDVLEEKLCSEGIFFAVPTLINDDIDELRRIAEIFKNYKRKNIKSIFPFLRVEGPFISREKKGSQKECFILEPDERNIQKFLSIDEIKIFTFAPEIIGVEILVDKALSMGKIPSIGHSDAGYEDFLRFYRKGVRHMTHFPNAMSGLYPREIGLLGAGLLKDDLQLEVIADEIHNSFDFLSLVFKIKGHGFSITSDMIPPAYSDSSDFEGRKILKKERRITTEDGILAGGSTSVPEQVKLLHKRGVKAEDIVFLACLNAKQYFGFPLPLIEEGKDATFLLLDEEMGVEAVYASGERIR